MRVARIGWVLLASWSLPSSLTAQKWFDEFRPDPRCSPVVGLSGVQPDGPEATGGLVVRGVSLTTHAPLRWTWVRVTLPADSNASNPLTISRAPDSLRRHRLFGLPAGPVVVTVGATGFQPTVETLQVRSNVVDTVAIPLRLELETDIRCSPPRFRRTGQPACVTDRFEVEATLDLARGLVDQAEPIRPGLGQFTLADVSLIHDETICDRAGRAYGGGKGPARRVIVVRLGNAGYVVYDPFEPEIADGFTTTILFDRRWRILARFVG